MDDTQRTGWQKRILLFLTNQCITLFGSTLVQMALIWYATMQTSSGVWVAAFTVGSYLPQFLISFIGGVWADRYHRKKLIIGAVFAVSTLRTTLMTDIVTAILGTGLLSGLVLPKQDTSFEKSGVLSDMKIGVRYAFSDRVIGKLLIIYGLFTFFCVPAGYLAGLLVRRVFGDTYW